MKMKKTNHSLVDMVHADNDIHHYHINDEYVVMLMEEYQLVQQLLLMLLYCCYYQKLPRSGYNSPLPLQSTYTHTDCW